MQCFNFHFLCSAVTTLLFVFCIATASANTANNRVLFITNSESGFGNIVLATAYALVINHPDVEVHIASFPRLEKRVASVSSSGRETSPSSNGIVFHTINGKSYVEAIEKKWVTQEAAMHAPGIRGQGECMQKIGFLVMPWSGPDYVELYHDTTRIIKDVDPDVVVLDTMMVPAVEASSHLGKKQMFLSANSLKDIFSARQPWGALFWKYPALGSGYQYPLPWHQIPGNILMNFRLIYALLTSSSTKDTKTYLKGVGLTEAVNFFEQYKPNVPWISPSKREYEYPLTLPPNVTEAGPIVIVSAPVGKQDPELAKWLSKSPTILISLGSHFAYSEEEATEMVKALVPILQKTRNQVLWKFNKRHDFSDDFLKPVQQYIDSGRFRLETWIKADLGSLLESKHVVLFVHHGGANCFNEALAAGVPHIILPAWADLYDYAVRSEWLGVGIWANKNTAPDWTSEELGDAFQSVLGKSEAAMAMRMKAREIGQILSQKPGRDVAAQAVVDWLGNKAKDSPPSSNRDEL